MIHLFRGHFRSLLLLVAAATASSAAGQPPPGTPPAAPAPDAPNPPPEPAAAVADFYTKLITAKPADVETLQTKAAEFPFCRLRLCLPPTVGDRTIVGVDYGILRATGRIKTIALSGTSAAFRSRLNRLLAEPAAAAAKNGETGVRIVDFWCQRSDQPPAYVPLLAKVWANSTATDIPSNDSTTPVPGSVCHADTPAVVECQNAFDFSPPVFKKAMTEVEAPASTLSAIAEAISAHRTDVAATIAKLAADRPTTKRSPSVGGAVISLDTTHALGEESCTRVGTAPRVLAGGESFIGLTPEVKEGTVTLKQKLPFPVGGGVLRIPARITSAKAAIEVDLSKDGGEWTRLFLLAPTRGRAGGKWEADDEYPLPQTLRGAKTLQIRARLTSTDETAGLDRAGGPRFLDAMTRVPRTTELLVEDGLVRTASGRDAARPAERPLEIVVQPERLDAQALAACAESGEEELDIYAPCDLDEAACTAIAKHRGTIRFWSADEWQLHPPAWLSTLAAGDGRLEFVGLREPLAALATQLAAGKKSLSFPAADAVAADVLAILARTTAKLSLDGLKELSAEQAAALDAYRGPGLSLAGVRQAGIAQRPGATLAAAVVASSGTFTIGGSAPPDAATLAVLASGSKHLVLDGLESLDPQAAKLLAASSMGLTLGSLTSLPQEAADPLQAYAGPLLSLPRLSYVESSGGAGTSGDARPAVSLQAAVRRAAAEASAGEPQPPGQTAASSPEKDLDAILADAVERGVASAADKERIMEESKTLGGGQQAVIDRLRAAIPLLAAGSRLGLSTGTPLAAFVDAPGVFALKSPAAAIGVARKGRPDKTFFETLAGGRKHLNLNDITSLEADAAKALAAAEGMVSLDGITSITAEVATALAAYRGPFLSLNGLKAPDNLKDAETLLTTMAPLLDLVREDRAAAGGLYMMSVDGMRGFAIQSIDSLPEKQKKIAKQFQSNSGPRDWTNLAGQRVKGRLLAMLGTDVIIETPAGPSDKIKVTDLAPASFKVVKTLAELGSQLAPFRTTAKFAAEGGPPGGDAADAAPAAAAAQ